MRLISKKTGKRVEAAIEAVNTDDLKLIKKSRKFGFNWNSLKVHEIFKLKLIDNSEIIGLIAIEERPEDGYQYIEIKLLESSKDQVGQLKEYDGIAGCLIAYACYQSFIRGYDGYIMLIPKTALIKHYINIYGFEPAGKRTLFLNTRRSSDLIRLYLEK